MKKALLGAIVSFSLFLTACGGSPKGYSFKEHMRVVVQVKMVPLKYR